MSEQPVAVISAGASGIGLAIAEALHGQGYALYVLDIDGAAVDIFCQRFGQDSATVCDVADPGQVDAAFARFHALHDRVDLLVN
ncbi:MAG: SDR family oxidoreductase, partial [Luminiphilus sp.]